MEHLQFLTECVGKVNFITGGMLSQVKWHERENISSFKRHAIKPGTPEHGTTAHGTPVEHRKTGRTSEHRILAEQWEYHGRVEYVKCNGTT